MAIDLKTNSDMQNPEWNWNFMIHTGNIACIKHSHKFGYNPVIAATLEDIWDAGGVRTDMTSATVLNMLSETVTDFGVEKVNVVSDSADDDSTGAGCTALTVVGTDENGNSVQQILDVTGTTSVVSTEFFRSITTIQADVTCTGTLTVALETTGSAVGTLDSTNTTVAKATPKTSAGGGAEAVTLVGLDSAGASVSEEIFLNGTTYVTGAQTFKHLNRAFVSSSSVVNLGLITIEEYTGSTTQATLPVGLGTTRTTHFMVPAGKYGLIHSIQIDAPLASHAVRVDMVVKLNGEIWRVEDSHLLNSATVTGRLYALIPPLSTVKFQAIRTSGASNVEVATTFDIDLIDAAKIDTTNIHGNDQN